MPKKIKKLFAVAIIKLLYLKIGGKQVFINRYTKKIPVMRGVIETVESITIINHSKKQIEKDYKRWFKRNYPNKKELARQAKLQKNFANRPLISILVPTYNTKHKYLRACIDSVIAQSYDNWELCIADDASTDAEVRETIEEYTQKDKRIKKVFRKSNGHISKASNSALKISKGEYIALLDHDDLLWPNALFENVKAINNKPEIDFLYSDEDKIDRNGTKHSDAFFKPDWSPEFLRSINYITHFAVIRRELVEKIGGFRPGYEGAQDWDLFLRISRETQNIHHIPKVLYSWRMIESSTALQPSAKDYAYVNQKKALEDDIKTRGLNADIEWEIPFSMWHVAYKLKTNPKVSIIIPTKDQHGFISRCLESIKEKTTYDNFEIIIVDTGSTDENVWELYDKYKKDMPNAKVVKWNAEFNFSSVCNFGANKATGEYFIFLNNDTEVITKRWIEEMLGYAQQDEIGAVGCKLYYPDGKLQHAGIILGVGGQSGTPGIAGHFFPAYRDNPPQTPTQKLYMGGTRNFTAVTAACVMVSKNKFNSVHGFDPKFKIAFNDVDLCLKLLNKNWRNVYLPHVQLFHYESVSIGKLGTKKRDSELFAKEIQLILNKSDYIIQKEPYYHPEFRRDIANAMLKKTSTD
jgi:GT2 family glycosyltransferase